MNNKKLALGSLLSLFLLFGFQQQGFALVKTLKQEKVESLADLPVETIAQNDRAALEGMLGRKMNWKERMAFKNLKKTMEANPELNPEEAAEKAGIEYLGFPGVASGIAGMAFLSAPLLTPITLGIIAIFFSAMAMKRIKNNPKRRGKVFAYAGLLLGVSLYLFVAFKVWQSFG